METLQRLTNLDELDAALASSGPILIFKHSPTCGISVQAHEEVAALLAGPPLAATAYCVLVREGRAVSNAIATRLNIRHQSPQIILVERGVTRWHASHFRVTAAAIRTAVEQCTATATG